VSQPVVTRQISDAERIAILDKRIALALNGNEHNVLLHREPFMAVVHFGRPPITKSDMFWAVMMIIFTFGLGVIFCAILMLIRFSKERDIRFDVSPTGDISMTKLTSSR